MIRAAHSSRRCVPARFLPAVLLCLPAVFLLACTSESPPGRTPAVVIVEVTATPRPPTGTPSPSPSPTHTSTPTSTPTPTPTAPPAEISGDLRSSFLRGPTPVAGAYCGLVDTLDFPLNPPDAAGIGGGQDFGVYRGRYGKYHAGEDWGFRGGSAFGEPVYAIGHGVVTFADGLGWGPDKGVVIVRHTFEDGSTVLSFYGHLDPPSVALQPGACVTRGQQVGEIGRPRTSPHLHFEIRTIFPYVPGPGYWEEDPTTAGWLAPSAFINQFRIGQLPGVAWAVEDSAADYLAGLLAPETFVVREGGRLIGLYTPGGGVRWTHALDGAVSAALADEGDGLIYLVSPAGQLTALRLPDAGDPPQESGYLVAAWEAETGAGRGADLVPVPWGGVGVYSRGTLAAFDADGGQMWSAEVGVGPDWRMDSSRLVVSAADGLFVFDRDGLRWQQEGPVGRVAVAEEGLYVLSRDRLTWLAGTGEEQAVLDLPEALGSGELEAAPGGGVFVLHSDRMDRRLLLIKEGAVLWERSVQGRVPRAARLLAAGGAVYLLGQDAGGVEETVTLLRIAIEDGALERIFIGSTRRPFSSRLAWASAGTEQLVLRFGAGSLVLLDMPALGSP